MNVPDNINAVVPADAGTQSAVTHEHCDGLECKHAFTIRRNDERFRATTSIGAACSQLMAGTPRQI